MMECPRCGFSQPKDRFCANCGVDVDLLLSKPKSIGERIFQNPNLHLSLIGALVIIVVGYIFYSQRDLVRREMGALLDLPLSSREAGDPDAAEEAPAKATAARDADPLEPDASDRSGGIAMKVDAEAMAEVSSAQGALAFEGTGSGAENKAGAEAAKRAAANVSKVEVTFWEIPRDTLSTLLPTATQLGNSNGGRSYFIKEGTKANEGLQAGGQKVSSSKSMSIASGSMLPIETPPTAVEPFQYGLYVTLNKWESGEAGVKWDSTLVLPQPDDPRNPRPAFRGTLETTVQGNSSLKPGEAILIVMKVDNRTPRDEFLQKAGDGPWSIFASQEFRADLTDWVVLIQLR